MKKLLLLCFLTTLICSCSSTRMVKFTPRPQEVFTNNNLRNFLSENSSPNIVLRLPNSHEQVTTKSNVNKTALDIYYNAIEKELLKAGFSVRDRGLFNEVLNKMQRDSQGNIDYSQINELTNTDLILEVIKLDPSVKYATNVVITKDKKGNMKEATSFSEYKKFGASAEFKVILVKNNEMAGTYTFNYAPCLDGCVVSSFQRRMKRPTFKKGVPEIPAYEGVEIDVMEQFVAESTKDLVKAIKR